MDALRLQLQILMLLNRPEALPEPLKALLVLSPAADRPGLIAALPRFLQRANNPRQVAQLIEDGVRPYWDEPMTRVAARVAMGRAWMEAREHDKALVLAQEAHTQDPSAPGPALLALELLHLELKQVQQGEAALLRYLELVQAAAPAAAQAAAPAAHGTEDDDEDPASRPEQGQVQAWLMLAQAAEQRGDYAAADGWLARIEDPQRALEVQTRRALLLARQGQVPAARELLHALPERNPAEARAKLLAEVQLLREVKQWNDAYSLLDTANQRYPNDPDLLYEQAMVAEKLDRLDAMEAQLRRVIELKPDHAHAYNALGYSLADRKLRLDEAKTLIARALQLTPGDPFITDSLGWVEYRLGHRDEALRLLQQAYKSRPDAEIAAHLGEVLWVLGRQDEARRIWAEASSRDAGNEVLRETMVRLKAQ